MTTNLTLAIDELTTVGAVKLEAESYSTAWLLRNRINNELRRLGVKGEYTSAVIDNTIVVWRKEMFGGKGSKQLVMEALDTFSATYPQGQVPLVDAVFEEVKKERQDEADGKLARMIERMGGK
jgi:hypothetical protein